MARDTGGAGAVPGLDEPSIVELRVRLAAAVRQVCPSWLRANAEDIVQNALIRVVRRHAESGGDVSLHPSYLKKAAYNAAVDEMRKHFARNEIPADPDVAPEPESGRPGPSEHARAVEIHRGIQDCLSAMVKSRRVAVACHLQGYSVPEAAGFLGWTVKKTEHLVGRGVRDLRHCLESKGLQP